MFFILYKKIDKKIAIYFPRDEREGRKKNRL